MSGHLDHIAAMTDIVTLVMNSCTGFDENLDACVAFFEREDKHLTAAISESKADIQKILGFELP